MMHMAGCVLVLRWVCLAREKDDNKYLDIDYDTVNVCWKGGSSQSIRGRGGLGVDRLICVQQVPDQGKRGQVWGSSAVSAKGWAASRAAAEKEAWPVGSSGEMPSCRR